MLNMEKVLLFLLCIVIFSCTPKDNPEPEPDSEPDINMACGIEEPQKNILWLSLMIQKSEDGNDESSVIDTIWLERYKGKDVFVMAMPHGSSGEDYYLFDCIGNQFSPDNNEEFFKVIKKNAILYSNFKNDLQNLIRTNSLPKSKNMYVYPIRNDSEEWSTMFPQEKIAASQLPEDVLKSISSIGLICSFFDIPHSRGVFNTFGWSSSGPFAAFDYDIRSRHNQLQEFLTRKDAGKALLACYEAISFEYYEQFCIIEETVETLGEMFNFEGMLSAIEILFSRQEILDQLDSNSRKKAATYLLDKAEHWKKYTDEFEEFNPGHFITTYAVLAYLMYEDGYSPVVEYFYLDENIHPTWRYKLSDKIYYDLKAIDDIIIFAKSYIK